MQMEEKEKKPNNPNPSPTPNKQPENKTADENCGDEKKEEEPPNKDAPPPQEVVLKVFMHCDGCAKKVKRSLKGFPGVEDVITDSKTHKVVVKGEKAAADPAKVVERVQTKTHRRGPKVITLVLKVHMHCDACSLAIKKRILRMKGVESGETDLRYIAMDQYYAAASVHPLPPQMFSNENPNACSIV